MRLRQTLADVAVAVANPAVVQRLDPKQARLLARLARAPQLKVVVVRVGEVELALDVGDRRKVEVDRDGRLGLVGPGTEQDKLAARVGRHRHDRLDPDRLAERVVLPRQSLVEGVRDAVGRLLVVREEQDRAGVAKLPHVRVLVDFFPREAAVASQERVRVGVRPQVFADGADGEHESDGGRGRVGRAGVAALRVTVNMEGAVLSPAGG